MSSFFLIEKAFHHYLFLPHICFEQIFFLTLKELENFYRPENQKGLLFPYQDKKNIDFFNQEIELFLTQKAESIFPFIKTEIQNFSSSPFLQRKILFEKITFALELRQPLFSPLYAWHNLFYYSFSSPVENYRKKFFLKQLFVLLASPIGLLKHPRFIFIKK